MLDGFARHDSSKPTLRECAVPALAYGLMICVTIAAFMLIRMYGERMRVGAIPALRIGSSATNSSTVGHVLLVLVIIVVLARLIGSVFRLLHQPPVIGEMIAGILLGPSFFARIAPHMSAYVLPISIFPFLNVLAQVGVVLYMFLVGLDLDIGQLTRRGHTAVAISHASIIVPFVMGAALSLILFPRVAPSGVPFTSFALFLGVSMSITAFPSLREF
jgi:Kef-type K+ transport system membrane component KefB